MPRIEPKPISRHPWYIRLFLRRQERKYGRVLAPSLLWARLPGPFLGMLTLVGLFQRRRYPVDAALRSIVSIRVAQLNGCRFCVDLNSYNFLRAAGAEQKAAEVDRWRRSTAYTPRERAALAYAEEVTQRCAELDDALFATLKNHFTGDEITALTAWISFQNMSAKFNAALDAEEHGFCTVPPPESSPEP